ncbi:RNA-directed DNA polymerase [Maricaulis sp. MIT060901]|uniref:RNA-directed DNA polymerase n=1 Tax=Maricaulis sp. MIT060901 TaxID=3096993 RepID=UPI00399BBB98
MKSRFSLMNAGLYPETLPPCFVSRDSKRAFYGLVGELEGKKFHNRKTAYVRYNGTKHDGSRRYFGTPNIISYFYVSSFVWRRWKQFQKVFSDPSFAISAPRILDESAERAVKVPSLSELSRRTSEQLRYAPYVLKADIAQCFPSIYTHSIAWAAHGIEASKADTAESSKTNVFNELDFHVRNCQRGNTRGVLVGPDAFRLIAEFVLAKVDDGLKKTVGEKIIGAVRHVDDYYIGLRSEHDALSVLSQLREVLANYELNLNDQKTKISSSLEPINDLWAQRLRNSLQPLKSALHGAQVSDHQMVERAIAEAVTSAQELNSDSPIKILLRELDDAEVYSSGDWQFVEENLMRIVQKHPHVIDYACLLVAKRKALGFRIDEEGWTAVAEIVIASSISLNHHHEILWMSWLLIACGIPISTALCEGLSRSPNGHIRALLAQAYVDGIINRKPKLQLGQKLATDDERWLPNLVAKSQGFSKAPFSGALTSEFDHLAQRNIRLIDFGAHLEKVSGEDVRAISKTRYGYDDDEIDDDELDASHAMDDEWGGVF